ncbi:MAG: 5-formyltetrahydrofolate cyclo-ligase [Nitrospiria bacterium]
MNDLEIKQLIRRKQRLLRAALSTTDRQLKSREIANRLIGSSPFKKAGSIHLYLSIQDEVSTTQLVDAAHQLTKRIAVPVVDAHNRNLAFSELSSTKADILETGPFGVLQPRPRFRKPMRVDEIDLWVLPGLAFDVRGNRLGYGGGYYDRVLHRHQKPVIALAFEIQIVPQLPVETTDVPMDLIMTERRTIVCGEN